MHQALLPAGFHDLLFPDAYKKASIMNRFASVLHNFGYELVEPPIIEFENSLFNGSGSQLKQQTFRLMDPVSHQMMGVRSDITTQIARIAATRLQKSPIPLRLSYGGDVFRVKGEGLYAERQLTQSGIELIGVDNAAADAEVILVIVTALKKLGIEGICVDFTLPRLAHIILDEMQYADSVKTELLDAINKKNIAEIEKLAKDNSKILVKLASAGINVQDLQKIALPQTAQPLCARLAEVLNITQASSEDFTISIDPLESEKFGYHTGIGFTIFAKGAKGEIGRGGRYEIAHEGSRISATGATIYINEILRILPINQQEYKIFVPFGTNWQQIKDLANSEGKIVVCGSFRTDNITTEAIKQGCNFIFADGKIITVQ